MNFYEFLRNSCFPLLLRPKKLWMDLNSIGQSPRKINWELLLEVQPFCSISSNKSTDNSKILNFFRRKIDPRHPLWRFLVKLKWPHFSLNFKNEIFRYERDKVTPNQILIYRKTHNSPLSQNPSIIVYKPNKKIL